MGQHGRGEYGKKKEIDSICLWPKRGESRRMLNTVATKCFKIKKKTKPIPLMNAFRKIVE